MKLIEISRLRVYCFVDSHERNHFVEIKDLQPKNIPKDYLCFPVNPRNRSAIYFNMGLTQCMQMRLSGELGRTLFAAKDCGSIKNNFRMKSQKGEKGVVFISHI